jgi:hypothetical protein
MRWLVENNNLPTNCRVLDFGCGHGFDAEYYDLERYDPCFYPDKPKGSYDIITCIYVLNTLPGCFDRRQVLTHIDGLLTKGGLAYITVRTDKKALIGKTQRGTWQGLITLDLTVVRTTPHYQIYGMMRGGSNCTITAKTNDSQVSNSVAMGLTNENGQLCLK